MRIIRKTYDEFWNSFFNRSANLPAPVPIPAFLDGFAPIGQTMPFILYSIPLPNMFEFTVTTTKVYTRQLGSFGLLDDICAQIREAVPESGIQLDMGDEGIIWLSRNTTFIAPYDDGEDTTGAVRAAIVSLIVKGYVYE